MSKIDDRYTEQPYYYAATGEFYTVDRSDDGERATLRDPRTGEELERLSADEFHELQQDLLPIPQEAVRDPVEYFEHWVAIHSGRSEMDVGLLWADRVTEVVEVGEVEE